MFFLRLSGLPTGLLRPYACYRPSVRLLLRRRASSIDPTPHLEQACLSPCDARWHRFLPSPVLRPWRRLLGGEEILLNKRVEVTIKHGLDIAHFQVRTVIFN
jgi:hypothetical protein